MLIVLELYLNVLVQLFSKDLILLDSVEVLGLVMYCLIVYLLNHMTFSLDDLQYQRLALVCNVG